MSIVLSWSDWKDLLWLTLAQHEGCDIARLQLAAWSLVRSYDSLMLHFDSILHQQRNVRIGYRAGCLWKLYSIPITDVAGADLDSQEKQHREDQWLFRL